MQGMVHEAKYDKIFKGVRRGASFVDGCFSNFCLQESWKERVDILSILKKVPKYWRWDGSMHSVENWKAPFHQRR